MDVALCQEARRAEAVLTKVQKALIVLGRKHYLGHEMPPGFVAPTPFYLFFCIHCSKFAKDYPHGYDSRTGKYFLRCCFCNEKTLFRKRPKEIDVEVPTPTAS